MVSCLGEDKAEAEGEGGGGGQTGAVQSPVVLSAEVNLMELFEDIDLLMTHYVKYDQLSAELWYGMRPQAPKRRGAVSDLE